MACHNRRENTLACLTALTRQSLDMEVVRDVYLLDDGSTDGTSESVRGQFPDVHILEGDGNLYWNRGMHKSFAAAIQKGFDYYLWLNDDSTLYPHALQILLDTHADLKNQGHECAIIGSAMQDPITGKFTYGGVKRHRSRFGRVRLERIGPGDSPIQCDATNGNCVLIPDSVVKKVGNLDPVYQHRGGDHDYCFRALQKGCSVWLAPGYLGTCTENPIDGTWEDVNLPMMERLRRLNSPHGYRFHEYAIYLRRHRGSWWPAHLIWPYVKILLESIKF
jgi:GT2 family glycosyltransferase